jgi:hypothetical protein
MILIDTIESTAATYRATPYLQGRALQMGGNAILASFGKAQSDLTACVLFRPHRIPFTTLDTPE